MMRSAANIYDNADLIKQFLVNKFLVEFTYFDEIIENRSQL